MTPDLEEMIRKRAHEIWEQEGRSHGRHEEHWHKAVTEVTQELDRIKAMETPAAADIMAAAPRKARQSRTAGAEQATPSRPRTASRTASGHAEGAGAATPGGRSKTPAGGAAQVASEKLPHKRAAKRVGDEAPGPAGEAAPRTTRRIRRIEAE